MREGPSQLAPLVTAAILAALTVAVFQPVLQHDFNQYDDEKYVTGNRHVKEGLTAESVGWAMTASRASNWHPLTWISHMLDWELYGDEPRGHHLTNLILHTINTLLLFLLLRRFTGSVGRSAVVAALFAVHPLHVESVAWIAERKDVLSTFFWLLATMAYGAYARSRSRLGYALTAVLLALGLMAKPMLVTLPFTLLLLDYWPLNRWDSARWRELVLEKVPFFLVVVASSIITFLVQQSGGAVRSLDQIPLGQRIANSIVAYATYLEKTVVPRDLAVFYPHPRGGLAIWIVLVSLVCLILLTGLAFRYRENRRWLWVGWLWYLGTLVPVIGLVQVGQQALADRYTYVPLIGIFVAVVWAVGEGLSRVARTGDGRPPLWGLAPAIVIILVFCFLSRAQLTHWQDAVTLFQRAIAVEESDVAHNNLGKALKARGELDQAAHHYQQAIRINPRHYRAHNNLGNIAYDRKQYTEAQRYYAKAIEIKPDYALPHGSMGRMLLDMKQSARAEGYLRRAVELNPDSAGAYVSFGIALESSKKLQKAASQYEHALRLQPDNTDAMNNLGSVLNQMGRPDLAFPHFKRLVELRPDFGIGHYNLATSWYAQGRYAEAWREIDLARRYGVDPPESFLRLLSAKAPR